MAVIDLYSPRIAEEGRQARFKAELLTNTLNEAAKQLFQYSYNKDLIDKAYAQIGAEAEATRAKTGLELMKHEDEMLGKRINTTALTIALDPEHASEQQKGELEGLIRDYTHTSFAFPRAPDGRIQLTPDVVNSFRVGLLDEQGRPNLQGFKTLWEMNRPLSDIGNAISDYQKFKEQGYPTDSPQMQGLMSKILDDKNFPAPERVIIDKDIKEGNWDEAWRKVLALHAAGATKSEFKVVSPSEQAQERLLLAGQMKTKLAEVRSAWDVVSKKNTGWLNPATGMGAETLNNVWSRLGYKDPDLTEFQKRVNEYEAMQIRLMAGLNQTAQEALRTKGYLINNQLPMSQFPTALDLNADWADQDYSDRYSAITTLGGTGGKGGIPAPPPPAGPKSRAKPENQLPTPQNAQPQRDVSGHPSLKASQAEQQRLRQKARQKRIREVPPGDQMPMSPQSMLFLNNLERFNAIS